MTSSNVLKITLSDIFLSAEFPISEVGIFVGCGASKEAGYPLTWELTKAVLEKLTVEEIALIEEILKKENLTISIADGFPDIEMINDFIMKIRVQTDEQKYKELEARIISLINNHFENIKNHNLSLHRKFLLAIKNRSQSMTSDFWIFTTNYDLLFEEAAALEKIPLENTFTGTTLRYLNVDSFLHQTGEVTNGKVFVSRKEVTIRLIKLHGSLSWHQHEGHFYEGQPAYGDKVLILPASNKVIDTLQSPYDSLFTLSSHILGEKCKYLLCFGHSFRDSQITKTLLLPKLKAGKLKIIALLKDVTPEVEELAAHTSFSYISEKKSKIAGKNYDCSTDLWKFSSLVKFIQENQL